jgi:NDP-sugar pyrophosphorylase family protein
MKVVILAGGLGTRLMEETSARPKPMVESGGKPIIWHIMKMYEKYGFSEFIICLGYKGQMLKEYFINELLELYTDIDNKRECSYSILLEIFINNNIKLTINQIKTKLVEL